MTKRTAFYFWLIPSTTRPGKKVKSTYRMTEETAQSRFPGCVKADTPPEWRDLPETPDEVQWNTHTPKASDPNRFTG
jgi:hypothetical protein